IASSGCDGEKPFAAVRGSSIVPVVVGVMRCPWQLSFVPDAIHIVSLSVTSPRSTHCPPSGTLGAGQAESPFESDAMNRRVTRSAARKKRRIESPLWVRNSLYHAARRRLLHPLPKLVDLCCLDRRAAGGDRRLG